jgi:hypothetical protein
MFADGMIKSLRMRPLLCAAQVLAFIIVLPAFFSTVSFTSALTPEQAITECNKPLPSGWTAGVMNHGNYYRWWTIPERPILFGASLFLSVSGILFIWGSLYWVWRKDPKNHPQAVLKSE